MSDKPMQATKNDLMQSALDHYNELATKANHWMSDIPKAIRAYYSEPNQPAPKSADGMTSERIKEIQYATAYPESHSVYLALLQVWNECAQSALRYVTDEEIDAMFPYLLVGSVREQTKWNEMQEMRRIGAKSMRDMIFGGVKQ